MIDNLFQLQKFSQQNEIRTSLISEAQGEDDIDIIKNFMNQVTRIRLYITYIKENNKNSQQYYSEIIASPSIEKQKENMEQLQNLAIQNKQNVQQIKKLMAEIDQDIQQSQREFKEEPETNAQIIYRRAIQKQIGAILVETQTLQNEYKKEFKSKLERKIKIIDQDISRDELDELSENPRALQNLLIQQTMGKNALQIEYTLRDIREQYDGIRKLQQSYELCFSMLEDIALLIHEQGEKLNNIEVNLDQAHDYVQKANQIMEKVQVKHQQTQKQMCCAIIIGLVALGLVLTPIIMKITASKTA